MLKRLSGYLAILFCPSRFPSPVAAQESLKLQVRQLVVYAGIEVGARGQMSLLELGKDLAHQRRF